VSLAGRRLDSHLDLLTGQIVLPLLREMLGEVHVSWFDSASRPLNRMTAQGRRPTGRATV